jgi:hypothetical protein
VRQLERFRISVRGHAKSSDGQGNSGDGRRKSTFENLHLFLPDEACVSGCICDVLTRLFIGADFAISKSVTDFWHPVYGFLYTRNVYCSATDVRSRIAAILAVFCQITFAMQQSFDAKQHVKGFARYHFLCSGIPRLQRKDEASHVTERQARHRSGSET